MTAQLLSYAIWVTYAETTWPPLPLPFYYFEKWCRHLLVELALLMSLYCENSTLAEIRRQVENLTYSLLQ